MKKSLRRASKRRFSSTDAGASMGFGTLMSRRRKIALATLVTGLLLAGLPIAFAWMSSTPSPPVQYTDVTQAAGLTFHHINGATGQKYYVETIGPGCAFFD